MPRGRPHTQSELAKGLERWYEHRQQNAQLRGGSELSPWEEDEVFMALAISLWPVDMEAGADPHYVGQTSRMRLRLRWEGFRAGADAELRLDALLATAEHIRGLRSDVVPARPPARRVTRPERAPGWGALEGA